MRKWCYRGFRHKIFKRVLPQSRNKGLFVKSLPHNIILDWSKLKAFADNNLKVAAMMIYAFDMVENIMGKGGNAGYQHSLIFPQYFQSCFFF